MGLEVGGCFFTSIYLKLIYIFKEEEIRQHKIGEGKTSHVS